MRQTILIMLIFTFTTQAKAQIFKVIPPSIQPAKPAKSKSKSKLNSDIVDTTSLKRLNSQNFIAKLRQDNMPCILPIPSGPEIPNGYYHQKTYLGKIPNAWDKRDSSRKAK